MDTFWGGALVGFIGGWIVAGLIALFVMFLSGDLITDDGDDNDGEPPTLPDPPKDVYPVNRMKTQWDKEQKVNN